MIGVAIAAGAATGLASTLHCAAMCGPLAAFAGRGPRGAAQYHGARIAAYAVMGSLAGATGTLLADSVSTRWLSALLSWTLAGALAYGAWRLWRGRGTARSGSSLVKLGRSKPTLAQRIFARMPRHPAVVGGLTALLPCGALYAALLVAAASGEPIGGALSMIAFGAVSAIGLGVVSTATVQLRRAFSSEIGGHLARGLAVVLVVGAVVLAVRPIDGLLNEQPASCHSESVAAGD